MKISKLVLIEHHDKEGVAYYSLPRKSVCLVCDVCSTVLWDISNASPRVLLYHNQSIEWQLAGGGDWVSVNEEPGISTQYCCQCAEIQLVAPRL